MERKKLKTRRRPCPLALFLALIVVLIVTYFLFLPPLLLSNTNQNQGRHNQNTIQIHAVKPRFTILKKKTASQNKLDNDNNNNNNNVRKPFQWYRDHWYQKQKHPPEHPPWQDTNLPSWMKEYFVWHQQQTLTTTTTSTNNNSQRYLVLQCLEQDKQCGGLADRLLALPFLVLLAAQSQRILLLVWTVPFPLEEFLMPRGLDWMLSSTHSNNKNNNSTSNVTAILSEPSILDKTVFVRVESLQKVVYNAEIPVVRTRIQDYTTAWQVYDQYQLEHLQQQQRHQLHAAAPPPPFAMQDFRELFFVFFHPSPGLAQALQDNHTPMIHPYQNNASLKLPNPYVVAHYRALYGSQQPPPPSYIDAAAKNAIHCASQLIPGAPIVFLSDSIEAVQSIELYKTTRENNFNQRIIIPPSNRDSSSGANDVGAVATRRRQPLHLDKASRRHQDILLQPSDFYDTFLDLFLMARARCISYGQGGFGKMGSLLSYNRTCSNRHFENGKMVSCS